MSDLKITKTGYWVTENKEYFNFEPKICLTLSGFFEKHKFKTIYDFGCGSGEYVKNFNLMGFKCLGIDGNPHVLKFIQPSIIRDLAEPFLLKRWDCIICIDVAELIHPTFDDIFLDNLCNNADKSIVITWSSIKLDRVMVNVKKINDIIDLFSKRGFKLNATDTYALKNSLKREFYVFNRIYNNNISPTKDTTWE